MKGIIDVECLREEDLDEYKRINETFFPSGDFALLLLTGLAYPALTIYLAVMSQQLVGSPSDLDSLCTFIGIPVMLLGWIPVMWAWSRGAENARKARDKRLWEFRKRIGYTDSRKPRLAGEGGGEASSVSRRRMQHEWYEGHSGLNYTDRTRAEMYGMDVDTYISNVAEHDRD